MLPHQEEVEQVEEVPVEEPVPAPVHVEVGTTQQVPVKDESPESFGWISGECLLDRKSTFQPHLVRVSTRSEVETALDGLYRNNKIQRATHNMWAYRLWDPERGVQCADNDDDGEDGAGATPTVSAHLLVAHHCSLLAIR